MNGMKRITDQCAAVTYHKQEDSICKTAVFLYLTIISSKDAKRSKQLTVHS